MICQLGVFGFSFIFALFIFSFSFWDSSYLLLLGCVLLLASSVFPLDDFYSCLLSKDTTDRHFSVLCMGWLGVWWSSIGLYPYGFFLFSLLFFSFFAYASLSEVCMGFSCQILCLSWVTVFFNTFYLISLALFFRARPWKCRGMYCATCCRLPEFIRNTN